MSAKRETGEGTMLDERLHQPWSTGGVIPKDTKIWMRVVASPDKGKVLDVSRGGSFILGRGKADVVLADPKISSRHVELKIFGPGHYYLCDLASTNGTFLNGVRVDRRKFDHEDEIRIGDTVLRVSVHDGTIPVSE